MKLTDSEIEIIREFNIKKSFLDVISNSLSDEYHNFFEELMSRNCIELNEEIEELLVPSYYQFELRVRNRHLREKE